MCPIVADREFSPARTVSVVCEILWYVPWMPPLKRLDGHKNQLHLRFMCVCVWYGSYSVGIDSFSHPTR